ncbi:hypothetical protein C1N53_05105 [Pontibacter sp. SGAir0037]|nr:hypothetical protein C1N53_05105 [Pontibacter sp. SGAir0037]
MMNTITCKAYPPVAPVKVRNNLQEAFKNTFIKSFCEYRLKCIGAAVYSNIDLLRRRVGLVAAEGKIMVKAL